ncbi:glycosyltransferase family 2 protein [Anaeromicropila herbilytica]|uniref:glycosyltransferase family 2 protein n=1 Tax=Anaeromicropila herbilytica TaxID=2785025 RepID=UPI00232A4B61|nr:glycosyltransferase family 2 protein [Anaeromicropila herbilytica]
MSNENTDESILYLVVPCYQEEEVLPETAKRLLKKMKDLMEARQIHPKSRILFVNDGSTDLTWKTIQSLHEMNPIFSGVNLSRNKGHQNALLAGLMTAKEYADIVISMDADLQDDIEAIDLMLQKYTEGYDIVYGVRSSRKTDTFFKKWSAQTFYKMMHHLGVTMTYNHADYRLMSKRAIDGLEQYTEVNLFLRGLIPLIGYPSTTVEYKRDKRYAGKSKYPLKKMLAFALDGITSFSIKPIRLIANLGFIIFLISLATLAWTLICKILGRTVAGWTSLLASIWLLGGIQLLSIGIIGEYVGKIYNEVKRRPRYLIQDIILEDKEEEKVPNKQEQAVGKEQKNNGVLDNIEMLEDQ